MTASSLVEVAGFDGDLSTAITWTALPTRATACMLDAESERNRQAGPFRRRHRISSDGMAVPSSTCAVPRSFLVAAAALRWDATSPTLEPMASNWTGVQARQSHGANNRGGGGRLSE
jgi:hypothetical protein